MNTQISTILIDGREWKLVPYIVTPEMEKAADEAFASGEPTWPALLNSAPPAPPAPVASHEPASVSKEPDCVSSVGNAEAAWNNLADEHNGWDTLGADERSMAESMFAAGRNSAPPPEPAKAEVVKAALIASPEFWSGLQKIRNGAWSEGSFADAIASILSALATPPTAPAAARSAAEEMRKRIAVRVKNLIEHCLLNGDVDGADTLKTVLDDIRFVPLPGEEA